MPDATTAARYVAAGLALAVDPVAAGAELARASLAGESGGPVVLHERHGAVSVGLGAAAELVLTRREIRYRGPDGSRVVPTGPEPLT
ncbi:hypothetical protein OFN64_31085, partial [Escherichia coli]|nr:hypothetical protein [Escherichia coli]